MENNLNNQNNSTNKVNSGVTPSSPSFSSSPNQASQNPAAAPKFSTNNSGYIRPEDIVRENPATAGDSKASPVFAYSKTNNSNPYLPSGYSTTTELKPNTTVSSTMQNTQTVGTAVQSSPSQTRTATESAGGDLNFGANQPEESKPAVSSGGFEVVGNKVPTAVSRSKKTNLKKLNASRITESRFCGHFAWFFSIANIFVCLFFILVNILLSQVSGEGAQQNDIVVTLNAILEIAPYATLVVCAFTLISLINSIVQLTIRVNKYSKLTILIVFLLSIAAFVYLYFVGYLGETIKLLSLATA